jgi:hypothetical protein
MCITLGEFAVCGDGSVHYGIRGCAVGTLIVLVPLLTGSLALHNLRNGAGLSCVPDLFGTWCILT